MDYILGDLVPAFGGMPTFVEDPDGLLDQPEAREALRAAGMTIGDWDGLPTSLIPYKNLPDDEMPLLVVEPGAPQHIVRSCLQDYRWEAVSIGEMLPKFPHDLVKAVPSAYWDALFALHDEVRSPRSAQETAILIARAVYGIDPEYLEHGDGWLRTLLRLAAGDEPLPCLLASVVAKSVPAPACTQEGVMEEALSATVAARSWIHRFIIQHPNLREQASPSDQALLAHIEKPTEVRKPAPETAALLPLWTDVQDNAQSVYAFGLRYSEALAAGAVTDQEREKLYERFAAWLMDNYGILLSAANPALLRLPTLVNTLDTEITDGKLLLVVVDALGLEAWHAVKARWLSDGVIRSAETRVALAVLPTITSLSRRAIFEGKPPAQFGPEPHSQRLERKLWLTRFPNRSGYYTVDEGIGLGDALAMGKSRICLLDSTWDKRGHSIDPRTDSIVDAARVWAGKTPLRHLIEEALQAGYRVVITSDHGQVACYGKECLQPGVLPDERSKRVMLFHDKAIAQRYERPWACLYKPAGTAADCYPLFARGFASFDTPGMPSVSHGGMTMEEALVPVAEVKA